MRSTNIKHELIRVKQILNAANIALNIEGNPAFETTSPLIENVLSMCMKEAVTNVVKHSFASYCHISFINKNDAFEIEVMDVGIGISKNDQYLSGSGLTGMRERLDFVDGSLHLSE